MTRPPGPRGNFLTGNLLKFRRDPLGFLTMCARNYGPIVRLRFPRTTLYLINEPDYIKDVLVTNQRNFVKGKSLRSHKRVFGNGLLTSDGESWMYQRRLAQPAFHRKQVSAYGDVMLSYTERMLSTWQESEIRDIHEDMKGLTLAIVGKTLFNADVASEANTLVTALKTVYKQFASKRGLSGLIPEVMPTPANLRYKRAVQGLDKIIHGIIRHRRASGEDPGDLLSMLLHARDEDGSQMTDKQLRDEAMTLFIAGHDAPSLALSWVWYLLSQHPQAEEKLVEELKAVLNTEPPSVDDLSKLSYTEMVIKEAMRLYPPAWLISREALEDCNVGGYHVPSGTQLIMSQWVTHRDPSFFPNPEEFIPDRWADSSITQLPEYAYFPFGGGPRTCIGNTFAMMETVLIV
ncbi:MAG: cytochrome P450, partial [Thermodesulfobacteriota bacterium]